MRRRLFALRGTAAFIVGVALGVTASAGTALLLYTGQGFLRAAGLLVACTIIAVAAGVWAGAPEDGRVATSQLRWAALTFVLFGAGLFAAAWNGNAALRGNPFGSSAAVLLILALHAYFAGWLLVAVHARDAAQHPGRRTGSVTATATAGVALGIVLATLWLINNVEPDTVYFMAAVAVATASLFDRAPVTITERAGGIVMTDHVALITGVGSAGQLGYTLAERFLRAGARVAITARGNTDDVTAALAAYGDVIGISADLANDDDVARLIESVRARFGRLDSVINAVGGLTLIRSIEETTPEAWDAEVERNVGTVLRVCRAALPLLRESRGAIVNFASPAGEKAVANLGAYSAAKAGVIALTRALAVEEVARGVRVNAIAPGMMDTAQNIASAAPAQKYVSRDDVADAALFLAGDAARGVSGEVLHVAGPTLR